MVIREWLWKKTQIEKKKNCLRIHKCDIKTNKDKYGTAKHFNEKYKNNSNIFQFLSVQVIDQVYGNATRSSHRRCCKKKVFLEISQNSQENTCARVSFSIKFQALDSRTGVFLWILQIFQEHLFITERRLLQCHNRTSPDDCFNATDI